MASLIKNQIVKHLSKFVKNLSQDKISLSTLKGEGDLSDLELDEKVLMDLLDLPTWVVLTKAVCNRVHIKIPWTKLKTHPASLYLDQVEIEMEITEDLRQQTEYVPLHSSGGKYGFSDKVIDGLFVVINAITINFHSTAFQASAQISRFRIRSMRPTWQVADLRLTRIKDLNRGEILIFKEADWLSLRIEIDAIKKDPSRPTTPIRLITNQGKVRFTIKKRLSDCVMLTSKVHLLLEDLLWVLTDSQVKAVIEYSQYLGNLNKKSKNLVKTDTNIESQSQLLAQQSKNQSTQGTQHNLSADALAAKRYFDKYDVVESSYHVVMNRVDLHLCDEQNRPESEETFKRRIDGGAMQVSLQKLSLDLYPYHIANTSRAHWERYDEAMSARDGWVEHLMVHFRHLVKCAQEQGKTFKTRQRQPSAEDSPGHHQVRGQPRDARGQVRSPQVKGHPPTRSPVKQARLLENTFVIRIEDFTLYSVSTAQSSHKAPSKKFVSSDKKALFLPPEMSSLHIEHTSYYFPDGLDFPLPQPNIFAKLNPVHLYVDYSTILWLYQFANNMATGVKDDSSLSVEFEHRDIRIDALMPKLTLPAEKEMTNQPDRPTSLQLLSSQLTISNSRLATHSSKSDLGSALQKLYAGKMCYETETFPNAEEDIQALPQLFWDHAYKTEENGLLGMGKDVEKSRAYENGSVPSLREKTSAESEQKVKYGKLDGETDETKTAETAESSHLHAKSFVTYASEDVWCLNFEQLWLELVGAENAKGRPVSLIEAAPMTIWAGLPTNSKLYSKNKSNKRSERPSESASSNHSKLAIYRSEVMQRRKLLRDYYKSGSSTESLESSTSSASAAATDGTPLVGARSMSDSVFVTSRTALVSDSRDYYSDSKTSSPPPPQTVRRSTSTESNGSSNVGDCVFSSASSTTGLQDGASREGSDKVPDRCILLHSDSKMRLMLNHYQLLFLLRLLDSFSNLVVALEEDYVMFHKQPSPLKSTVLSLRLTSAELTLLMPPIPEADKDVDDKSDGQEEEKKEMHHLNIDVNNAGALSDGAASHDSGLGTPTTETRPDLTAKPNPELKLVEEDETQTGSTMQTTDGAKSSSVQLELEDEPSSASTESAEEAVLLDQTVSETGIAIRENGTIQYRARVTETKLSTLVVPTTPTHKADASPPSASSQKGDLNALQALVKRADNIKKSFKGSSLTDLLNRSSSQVSLDDTSSVDSGSQWETLSISSDTSDAFAVLSSDSAKQGAGGGTYISGDGDSFSSDTYGAVPVTVVTEDRASSRASSPSAPSVSSSSNPERKPQPQIVSVVDLNIEDLQLGIQLDGENSAVKLTIGDFHPAEKGNQELEWFLSKRIAEGSSKWKQTEEPKDIDNPVLSARLTLGTSAERYCPDVGNRGHLGVDVQGMNTQILMSTVTNLLSLIEEELTGDYMPMDINISNANIKLKSDGIPAYPLTRPPGDEPVEFYLQSATVKRSLDGVYHINASEEQKDSPGEESAPSSEDLRKLKEENRRLKEQLDTTRSALQDVERERSSLFRSLSHMREELITSDREMREAKVQLESLGADLSKR